MAWTKEGRICPICGRHNVVAVSIIGDPEGAMPMLWARCRRCDYYFEFFWLTVFFIYVFPFLCFPFAIAGAWLGWACALVVIFTFCILGLLLPMVISETSLLAGFLDRMIMAKARSMARKGIVASRWSGDRFGA